MIEILVCFTDYSIFKFATVLSTSCVFGPVPYIHVGLMTKRQNHHFYFADMTTVIFSSKELHVSSEADTKILTLPQGYTFSSSAGASQLLRIAMQVVCI